MSRLTIQVKEKKPRSKLQNLWSVTSWEINRVKGAATNIRNVFLSQQMHKEAAYLDSMIRNAEKKILAAYRARRDAEIEARMKSNFEIRSPKTPLDSTPQS